MRFSEKLAAVANSSTLETGKVGLRRSTVETVQVNLGKLCNQACSHCHVEAGPTAKENMNAATFARLLHVLERSTSVQTLDLTGGAPELSPFFKHLVEYGAKRGLQIIDRCNLTVIFEKGQEELADFLKYYRVQVVASLPCYSAANVEKQRGKGVFDKSIEALKILNQKGYGKENTGLRLDLVYNPVGPTLPPAQKKLEQDYKRELGHLFRIEFNSLYTITNMPIKRFRVDLLRQKKLDAYMQTLEDNFNADACESVMCRTMVSVGWNGSLFDCDFNQMLDLPLASRRSLWEIESFDTVDQEIVVADHCYGCTAGQGSSCQGSLL